VRPSKQVWTDAVAGRSPRSDPAVTRDKKLHGAGAKSARRAVSNKSLGAAAKPTRNSPPLSSAQQPNGLDVTAAP